MKRMVLCAVVVLCGVGQANAAVIVNGGFNGSFDGWILETDVGNWPNVATAAYSLSVGFSEAGGSILLPTEGTHFAFLEATAAGREQGLSPDASISQTFTAEAGDRLVGDYFASLWRDGATSSSEFRVTVSFAPGHGGFSDDVTSARTWPGEETVESLFVPWTEFEYIFKAAGTYVLAASVQSHHSALTGGAAAYGGVDNIRFGDPYDLLFWDELGNGSWNEREVETELSRWIDPSGAASSELPSEPGIAIVRTNAVTVSADAGAFGLDVESGELVVSEDVSLTLGDDVIVREYGTLTIENEGSVVVEGNTRIIGKLALALSGTEAESVPLVGMSEVALHPRYPASRLEFVISGANPFTAGTYTLITAEHIDGVFGSVSGLGRYVSDGENMDGLTYTDTALTLTIDRDLHLGDANLSGKTDLTDFNIWNAHKFTTDTAWTAGDFNGDGTTDLSDFNIWNAHKFTVASGGAAPTPVEVPEPGAIAMLLAAAAFALTAHKRRRN